jgi:hypothetical protein
MGIRDFQQTESNQIRFKNNQQGTFFGCNDRFFHNLNKKERDKILDCELFIYLCEDTDKERIDWFTLINIYGEKVNEQEIRNAVYKALGSLTQN